MCHWVAFWHVFAISQGDSSDFSSSFLPLSDLALHYIQSFNYRWVWASCLERSLLGGFYISWGHAFCTPTHTWEHMHVHTIKSSPLTQRLINITAWGRPGVKAHALVPATLGSPLCSAVIKGKLKDDGKWQKVAVRSWWQQDTDNDRHQG